MDVNGTRSPSPGTIALLTGAATTAVTLLAMQILEKSPFAYLHYTLPANLAVTAGTYLIAKAVLGQTTPPSPNPNPGPNPNPNPPPPPPPQLNLDPPVDHTALKALDAQKPIFRANIQTWTDFDGVLEAEAIELRATAVESFITELKDETLDARRIDLDCKDCDDPIAAAEKILEHAPDVELIQLLNVTHLDTTALTLEQQTLLGNKMQLPQLTHLTCSHWVLAQRFLPGAITHLDLGQAEGLTYAFKQELIPFLDTLQQIQFPPLSGNADQTFGITAPRAYNLLDLPLEHFHGPLGWSIVEIPKRRLSPNHTTLTPLEVALWLKDDNYKELQGDNRITRIVADYNCTLTDDNIREFCAKFPRLESISIRHCIKVKGNLDDLEIKVERGQPAQDGNGFLLASLNMPNYLQRLGDNPNPAIQSACQVYAHLYEPTWEKLDPDFDPADEKYADVTMQPLNNPDVRRLHRELLTAYPLVHDFLDKNAGQGDAPISIDANMLTPDTWASFCDFLYDREVIANGTTAINLRKLAQHYEMTDLEDLSLALMQQPHTLAEDNEILTYLSEQVGPAATCLKLSSICEVHRANNEAEVDAILGDFMQLPDYVGTLVELARAHDIAWILQSFRQQMILAMTPENAYQILPNLRNADDQALALQVLGTEAFQGLDQAQFLGLLPNLE